MKVNNSREFTIEDVEEISDGKSEVDESLDLNENSKEEESSDEETPLKLNESKVVQLSSSTSGVSSTNSNPATNINNFISMRQSDELNRVRRQLDRTSDKIDDLQKEVLRLQQENSRMKEELKAERRDHAEFKEMTQRIIQEKDDFINENITRVHQERVEESKWARVKTWVMSGAVVVAITALAAGVAALALQIIRTVT